MRVPVVENEPHLAEAVRDGLRPELIAVDGGSALELLGGDSCALAVLDRDISGPGDEIARRIVASRSGMSLAMADRIDDMASGFELGADDYLRPSITEIAGLRLDPFRGETFRDGRHIALFRKQFAVLEVLVSARGGVSSTEEPLERAWDADAAPFTNTVSAPRRRLIATGYRIDATHS
jgi:two-component system response regulator VanR